MIIPAFFIADMSTTEFIKSLYQNNDLAKREIDLIICHVLGINTAALFIYAKDISQSQQHNILNFIQQRNDGKPLAYITGFKEFWTLNLKVNQYTLIPRPETEQIVELMLQWTDNKFTGTLLDLGTGTGAIALSIAQQRPNAKITATDISHECIKVAQYNQHKYSLTNINIFQSNWFESIGNDKFNYIISNPPYIAENNKHLKHLKHEPVTALIAQENGLADLFHIIQQAKKHLNNHGTILLEHGFNQHKEIQEYLNQNCYYNIKTHKDLAGISRITTAQYEIPNLN
ncbi:Peptide chain release factor N(5)-glutamine methyltransferase [hydrothermal vent metagenome]|uniref:peptide chain release factor N(5)-glutamine methyltransferase n=1 Tax=hydrothermal vent metagenome TaxID=652676 RepID=A0A3B0VBP1_9ZZZZ